MWLVRILRVVAGWRLRLSVGLDVDVDFVRARNPALWAGRGWRVVGLSNSIYTHLFLFTVLLPGLSSLLTTNTNIASST